MDEIEVEISKGKVILKRPIAGARNKALSISMENGKLNEVKMMMELLPLCIKSHPFGTTPVRQSLDNLDFTEYDKIIDGLKTLMTPKIDEEQKKKSEESSKQ